MPVEFFEWKNTNNLPPQEAFEDVECVINLAGENLMSARWTNVQKEKIYNSRVTSTRKLIEGLNKYANLPLEVFISVSGFNVYQESDSKITEKSKTGSDFLAKVCNDWEAEVKNFHGSKRSIILRTPMVLSHDCEFVKKIVPTSRLRTCDLHGQRKTKDALDPHRRSCIAY